MFTAQLVETSERAFQRTLQKLADATDRPVEQVLRQQGRLFAGDLAFHINPMGKDPAVGRSFQQSIAGSAQRFYKPLGWLREQLERNGHPQNRIDWITKLIRTGRHQDAQRHLNSHVRILHPGAIHIGHFDGGHLHRQHRWRRAQKFHPILIVTDWRAARSYITHVANRAGLAKGALINAGRQLDGKAVGFPRWITRHTTAPGRGTLRRLGRGTRFHGELTSGLRYAREALPLAKELAALTVRQTTAEKQLKRITDHNIRRALRGA